MIRVAVDALGGDRAPDEVVAGALEAASDGIGPILYGPAGLDTRGLPLVETTQTIAMDEKPADAVRAKRDSSLVRACRAVGEGDARPEHLLQFARMGAIFAEEVLELPEPSVGLLSIGEEPEKGNALTLEAHSLIAASDLNFQGNVESRALLAGAADVVVTDGFTGNVCLKLLEGTIKTLLDALRQEIEASARGKLGGLLIRPAARGLRSRLDPDTYGGAYLLGLRGISVIAHGNSSRAAVASAIRLAARGVEHRVVERLDEQIADRVVASARSQAPTTE
jgi:phosphate acyltransferase